MKMNNNEIKMITEMNKKTKLIRRIKRKVIKNN